MNLLGQLPASTSTQFSLNAIDWEKIARFALVQGIGLFVTLGVPWLLKFTYVWKGTDYTPFVLMVVNSAAEAGRRFLASAPKT